MNFKSGKKERWGCSPQTRTRAVTALDPQLAILRCRDKQTNSACRAGAAISLRASGPRKPGNIREESSLSPTDDSLAFPGCFASGLAARRRARSTMAPSQTSAFSPHIGGNQGNLQSQAASAIAGPGGSSPWRRVQGPRRPLLRLLFILHNMTVCYSFKFFTVMLHHAEFT